MPIALNKSDIARSFSEAVKTYGKWAAPQERIAEGLIKLLPENYCPERIIDIGCGTGLLTGRLHKKYPNANIHGIDLAPAMIETCRQNYADCPNLEFSVADAESTPFDSNVNLIASTCAFQWFENRDATLRRLSEVLAPGGLLAVGVPVAGSFHELAGSYQSAIGSSLPGLEFAKPEEYLKILKNIGLKIYSSQEEDIIQVYENAWEALRSFKGLGASFRNYPGYSPCSATEMRDLVKVYEARYCDHIQGTPLTYRIHYFLAERPV